MIGWDNIYFDSVLLASDQAYQLPSYFREDWLNDFYDIRAAQRCQEQHEPGVGGSCPAAADRNGGSCSTGEASCQDTAEAQQHGMYQVVLFCLVGLLPHS